MQQLDAYLRDELHITVLNTIMHLLHKVACMTTKIWNPVNLRRLQSNANDQAPRARDT